MKIIQLTAENVKKLTAVEISPDGNMVQITGKNGQGKTSVLDSIWWALAGTENIQKQPIRAGAEKARIVLKLGTGKDVEIIVERRITEKSNTLEVKTADGAKYPSPQKMLDDLLGSLTFDPLDFMRRDGKGQFEALKGLVKLDVDLSTIEAANKVDFTKRTDVNRDAKAKRAQAEGIIVPADLPEQRIDEAAILDGMQQASETNTDIERRRANREGAERQIESNATTVAKMKVDAERILSDAASLEKASADLRNQLDTAAPLPAPVDVSSLRQELEAAKTTNAGIASRERKQSVLKEAEVLDGQSKSLTKAMDKRSAEKDAAIAAAQMPIAGLSFGDGIVTYNGIPLEQASDAEQLMVSTAIAAAMNPKLRVIRIRDGSLLDEDAMGRLAAFADQNDMQIWIERVDGSGTVGFVMEDGHVRGHEPPPAVAAKDAPKAKVAA